MPHLRNGQINAFARAIEISRFFRDLILMDASEMNDIVRFIFISAFGWFCSGICVFNIRI